MRRFAFDFGTSSLGWAVFDLKDGKPDNLVALGSRIFSSTEADAGREANGDSKAKKRRDARAMRKGYDRRIQRYNHVSKLLVEMGLFPEDKDARKALINLSPYELRAAALKHALPLHHIGRAIWHINKHRGFKSNRKTDAPDEKGKIASAAERLESKMRAMGAETYGAFLAARQNDPDPRKRLPTRIRQNSDKTKDLYEFYPLRDMIIDEFDLICARQKTMNPDFPDNEQISKLRKAVFCQRRLKPVEPGCCSFYPDETRLMRAHPDAEEFVIYQKVNEIRITDEDGRILPLEKSVRDEIVSILLKGQDITWPAFRKKVGLHKTEGQISLEEGGEKKLVGSAMAHRFMGTSRKPGPFTEEWSQLRHDEKRMEQLLDAYKEANTDEDLQQALEPFALSTDRAKLALKCSLPDGYLNISHKAIRAILPHLKANVITYSKACENAELHHSDKRDGEVFDTLPYYNEIDGLKRFLGYGTGHPNDPRDIQYGRIANPTVHVGLNQLRRQVNEMIKEYGRPDEIVLELSRELKKNKKQKDNIKKQRDINRKANDSRRADLENNNFYQKGDRVRTREALQRMKLWEELGKSPNDRFCPYSGKPITSLAVLMSDEVEIEHILPRSRTLDDSLANKTVAFREWNRKKRNLSPAEAAEQMPDLFNLEDMIARSKTMPTNKRWRLQPDAMERFDKNDGLAARLLKETQHFGVVARHYLTKLNPANPEQNEMNVWVTSGRLTAELRRKWGINLGTNYKNRNDHRHHAQDAAVIGVTDRRLINCLSRAAAKDEKAEFGRILAGIEEPYPGFSDQVNDMAKTIIISHRANHRVAGQMVKDGIYGKVRENATNRERGEIKRGNLVVRRDLLTLTPKQIGQVRDTKLREKLEGILDDSTQLAHGDKKELEKALLNDLTDFQKRTGTRRVRCLYPKENAVPIGRIKSGKPYKYAVPNENLYVDIVELQDGSWKAAFVDVFEAYQAQRKEEYIRKAKARGETVDAKRLPKWQTEYPNARFIMRLHKGDTLQLFDEDGTANQIKRVNGLQAKQTRVQLANHFEAGSLEKRHKEPDDPFRWDLATISKLMTRRARRVRIDEIGRVRTVPYGLIK